MNRILSCAAALVLLVVAAPAAAQQYMHREDLPMHERQRLEGEKRSKDSADAKYAQQQQAERDRQRTALLKKPPLPAESNALLGSWRLGDGQRSSVGGLGRETGGNGLSGMVEMLSSMRFDKMACEAGFSGGITFSPSTYSGGGIAGKVGGPIAYRSGRRLDKPVTVAIPSDGRGDMMVFEIAGPNRILDESGCVLVRAGAPAANVAANAATAPGNARSGAASSSAATVAASGNAGAVVDGAAYRCGDGSLLHVSLCEGNGVDATCTLTAMHLPGLQIGKAARRADIATRIKGCEAGGIRYGADDKPVFVR